MFRLRPYEIEYLQGLLKQLRDGKPATIDISKYPLDTELVICCISECIYQNFVDVEKETSDG